MDSINYINLYRFHIWFNTDFTLVNAAIRDLNREMIDLKIHVEFIQQASLEKLRSLESLTDIYYEDLNRIDVKIEELEEKMQFTSIRPLNQVTLNHQNNTTE